MNGSRNIRVVVIGPRGLPDVQGGIERHCEQLYPLLAADGCTVTVYGRSPYLHARRSVYRRVVVESVPAPKLQSMEALVYSFIASLRAGRTRPDLVHYHGIGPSLFLPLARRVTHKPVVVTHHGFEYEREKWGALARGVLRLGERQLAKADAVIAVAPYIADRLRTSLSVAATWIPNGVTVLPTRKPGAVCAQYSLESGRYFLFVGRMVREKRVHDLLDAFRALGGPWKLVLTGAADHKSAESCSIREAAGRTPGVVLTGTMAGENLAEVYSNAGAFVLPSSHEGFPIALLEALSYGLRCIASDIPANRAVGYSGLRFFSVGDTAALVAELKSAMAPAVRDDNARRFVADNFSWVRMARQTLDVYRTVLRGAGGGAPDNAQVA